MINRLEATQYLLKHLTDEPIIASCGNPKFDLAAAGDRKENFYMWNSMGMASSTGLGLALARPDKKVVILDGDGAILMNLNSLTTAASKSPKNLIHVIWDNRTYQITGGQPTHTAGKADLAQIARGAGFEKVLTLDTMEAFQQALPEVLSKPGPWVVVVITDDCGAPGRPPKSPTYIKHRFMEALGSQK
ncbi:MAG: thiamine pyrophosphate-dependent enzyme [Nitrospira sp.]|nr:thiamine pyrophosphate-dependent enzyme [Nitrospira sp.]